MDIIDVNKTKLENTIDEFMVTVNDFTLLRHDRNRHDGGIAMFIRETIDFNTRTDLQCSSLEILYTEVSQNSVSLSLY